MRSIFWYPVLALLALTLLFGSTLPVQADDHHGAVLEIVSVKASPQWMVHYDWNIDHTAEPNSWEMWKGDRGRSLFTIAMNRSDDYESAWVQGEVCVANHGPDVTQDLRIPVELVFAGAVISVTEAINDLPPVLLPTEEACLRYRLEILSEQIIPGGDYTVRARVTVNNQPEQLPLPVLNQSVQLPSQPEIHNEQVKVNGPGGNTWTLTGSEQIQYEQTFTCDAAQGVQSRTATIFETGQTAAAEVNVVCYALEVWPVVRTYFNRLYRWSIDLQTRDQNLTILPDETVQVEYQVNLNPLGYTDVYSRAAGHLYIRNRAPLEARLTGLETVLSMDSRINLNCGEIEFPYSLPSGALISCEYSSYPEEGETITARAALQNSNHHYALEASHSGITSFISAPRLISFQEPHMIYESFDCVHVAGSSFGELGEVCQNDTGEKTSFTYTAEIGPYDRCRIDMVEERASFSPVGISSLYDDELQIKVNVPCNLGCTQPPGYWLTYSGYRSDRYDPAWDQFSSIQFFRSSKSWKDMIHTNTTTNPYYLLARQFIAARLNIVKGAQATHEIRQVLRDAEDLFNHYAPHEVARAKISLQREVQGMAKDLDHFNRGITGPGVCSRRSFVPGR